MATRRHIRGCEITVKLLPDYRQITAGLQRRLRALALVAADEVPPSLATPTAHRCLASGGRKKTAPASNILSEIYSTLQLNTQCVYSVRRSPAEPSAVGTCLMGPRPNGWQRDVRGAPDRQTSSSTRRPLHGDRRGRRTNEEHRVTNTWLLAAFIGPKLL